MVIICYTPFDKTRQDQLQTKITNTVKRPCLMVSDFDALAHTLDQNTSEDVLIVFFLSSMDELKFLHKNNRLLFNRRFIFILINGNDEMVSAGLSLYPRFITHMNEDFEEISAVIKKIILKNKSK